MEYIRGIEGFRGFLVVCILIYHLFTVFFPDRTNYFPGGFLAVEAFFVLSGFLIVRLLQSIFSGSENRLKAFQNYLKRRFMRIFPALAFTAGFLFLLVSTLLGQYTLKVLEESVSALSFSYNFYLLFKEVPYFQKYEEINFLLHLWSLSIEFQLYLITGLIFLIFGNHRPIKFFVFVFLAASSVFVNYFYFNVLNLNPDKIYLSTEARSFGFFIGGLLALFENSIKKALNEYSGYILGAAGSLGLLFVFFSFSEYTDWFYPFGFLVADVLSVFVIIGFLGSKYFRYSFDFLSWIGVRSYSLYLLHYPLFVLTGLIYKSDVFYITMVVLMLLPLSDLSYRLIEEPFRRLSFKFNLIPAGVSAMVLAILSSAFLLVDKSEIDRTDSGIPKTAGAVHEPQTEISPVKKDSLKAKEDINIKNPASVPEEQKHTPTDLRVFMIGDSVLLGASRYITKVLPNAVIDAKVGRQATEILDIIEKHLQDVSTSDAIIIHVGTNGYVKREILERIVSRIGPDKKVYFLTVNAPVPWKDKVNENIKNMQKYPNVRIIEWDKYREEDLFVTDRVHLSKKGIVKYASLIKSSLNLETSMPVLLITESKSLVKRAGADSGEKDTQPYVQKHKVEHQHRDGDKLEPSVQEILDSINQANL